MCSFYKNYVFSSTFIIGFTLLLIDTDRETLELVCPDPVFDPESVMYNISVMWNITNPLLSEGVGNYQLHLDNITPGLLDTSFPENVNLRPEVGNMNTVFC